MSRSVKKKKHGYLICMVEGEKLKEGQYWFVIKRKEVLIHATTRMDLANIMPWKKRHTQRSRVVGSIYMKCPEQVHPSDGT